MHSSNSSSIEEAEVLDTAIQDVGSENMLDGDQPAFNTQEDQKKKIEILQQELGMWKRKCEELIQKNK
jgi:hypothetical protein